MTIYQKKKRPKWKCFVCGTTIQSLKSFLENEEKTTTLIKKLNEETVKVIHHGERMYRHTQCEYGTPIYSKFLKRKEKSV